MRDLTDAARVRRFMRELGRSVKQPTRIYITGGATAVLLGWRQSTVDLDIKLVGSNEEALQAIPRLKEKLMINVELASPDDFIPPLPGWQERSKFIADEGPISFFHYDFYAQALAKLERWHPSDRSDAKEMLDLGLIEAARLRELFERIEPQLHRYPAVSPKAFRDKVMTFLQQQ